MRLAFCGASGTGKTTLARMWSRLTGDELNPVGSRSVAAEMGFRSPYDVDRALESTYAEYLLHGVAPEQAARVAMADWDRPGLPGAWPVSAAGRRSCRARFQAEVQRLKTLWEHSRESFVTDRTTCCDLAYSLLHCPDAVDAEFIERARIHMARYDLVVAFEIACFIDVDRDPARLPDLDYHARWERVALSRVTEWVEPGRLFWVKGGSPEDRLARLAARAGAVLPGG